MHCEPSLFQTCSELEGRLGEPVRVEEKAGEQSQNII